MNDSQNPTDDRFINHTGDEQDVKLNLPLRRSSVFVQPEIHPSIPDQSLHRTVHNSLAPLRVDKEHRPASHAQVNQDIISASTPTPVINSLQGRRETQEYLFGEVSPVQGRRQPQRSPDPSR